MAAEVTQLSLAVDTRQVRQATQDLLQFGRAGTVAERQSESLEKSTQTLRRAFIGLGAAISVRELVRYADSYQQVNARLRLVTSSAEAFARVQGDLIRQSEQTRTSLTATIDLYARVARATRELNVADSDRLRFTEAINKALIVSGASGASAEAAIIQLGQALASGVVRGEEFNSISEQAPRILEGVAQALGKTTGQLRAMAAEGQLTASVFFKAFLESADGIDREFQRIPTTIGQALTVAEGRLVQFIGGTSEVSGAGRAVAASIDVLSRNIDLLTAAAAGFATTKLVQTLVSVGAAAKANLATMAASVAAQKAQAAASVEAARAEVIRVQAVQAAAVADGLQAKEKLATLQVTQAAIVAARAETVATLQSNAATLASAQAQLAASKAAGALSYAIAQRNAAEVAINAALARQVKLTTELAILGRQQATVQASIAAATAAQTTATTAQAAATNAAAKAQAGLNAATVAAATATSTVTRVIGLLGGPIGIITTLLSLGASAWVLWGNKAEEATEKAAGGVDRALKRRVAEDVDQLNVINSELANIRRRNNPADAQYIRELEAQRVALTSAVEEGRRTLDAQQRRQDSEDMLSRNYRPRRINEVVDTSTVAAIRTRIKALEDLRDAAKIDSSEFKRYQTEIDTLEKRLQDIGIKKAPKPKADTPDVLGFDIAKIRRDLEGFTSAFSTAETIIEAQRQAGLLTDREYYGAKISFIELSRDAQIRALEAENARLNVEKGNNKERLENQRQIQDNEAKIALLRADASAQVTILGIQQVAALNSVKRAQDEANASAAQYLETIRRQNQRSLDGMGLGERQREIDARRNQRDDQFQERRNALDRQLRANEITREQYEIYLQIEREAHQKALAEDDRYWAEKLKKQQDWSIGAMEAIQNYYDESMNIAAQVERAFTNAFQGMEDALVKFITTGKLDFKSLADSIIADITRIIVKQQIMIPIMRALKEASGDNGPVQGGGGFWGFVGRLGSALFAPNADGGVYASPGLSAYSGTVVDKPTIFPFAKGIGLMGEAGPEAILPLKRGRDGKLGVDAGEGGSGRPINFTIHQNFPSGTTRATTLQAASDARRVLESASRNM